MGSSGISRALVYVHAGVKSSAFRMPAGMRRVQLPWFIDCMCAFYVPQLTLESGNRLDPLTVEGSAVFCLPLLSFGRTARWVSGIHIGWSLNPAARFEECVSLSPFVIVLLASVS